MNNNPGMDNDKQFEKTQSRTGNPDNDKILAHEEKTNRNEDIEGTDLSDDLRQMDEKNRLKDETEAERGHS
jgi:hypothetical protein